MGGEKERGIFRAATAEQIGKVTNARLKIGLPEHIISSTCYMVGRNAGCIGFGDASLSDALDLGRHSYE